MELSAQDAFSARMETTASGDVFLVWPTQFARRYAIEQSSDLAAWVAQPETHLGTGADARRYLFSLTPPPQGVSGPWEPPAQDTVRQHFSLSSFPNGQTLISWTQVGNSHRALVNDDWSTVTVGDQPLPFPALMWYADANSTPPVNFDFFTWNRQWQPLYASLVPSALPQEAQDRLALLLGNKEAIMNHAAAVISQSLNHPPDPPLPPGANQRRFIRIVETRPDSDADGLFDDEEMRDYLTDPWLWDSDDDGYTDLDEINAGTDPADASSLPASLPGPAAPPEIFVESRFRQVAGSVNRSGTAEEFHYDGRYVRRPANSGPWDAELQISELLATDGVDSFFTNYPYQSFQRAAQTLQIANWYWLAETDSTLPSGGEQSGGEAHEKAHQELVQIRLRLTKRAEFPISRTYLKILREAPFTDTEGRAATPVWPQPATYPPESWPITKVEPITLTISADSSPSANRLVSKAEEIKEAVENKKAKLVSLASVEFVQPKLDENNARVLDVDGNDTLEKVDRLRLCRWQQAFGWKIGDGPGGGGFQMDFHQKDNDRFHLKVSGTDPGDTITIATSALTQLFKWDSEWQAVTEDDATAVAMHRPDPDKAEWLSEPLILVDGEDDVTYKPGGTENQANDPTHAAGLDSTVKVTLTKFKNQEVTISTEKALYDVRINNFVVGVNEVPAAHAKRITESFIVARDVYVTD